VISTVGPTFWLFFIIIIIIIIIRIIIIFKTRYMSASI